MSDLKSNLTNANAWLRALYMVIVWIVMGLALFVLPFFIVIQFGFSIVTGSDNANLRSLCNVIANYLQQAANYLTYNSENKPFPFDDLPRAVLPDESSETKSAD